MPDSIVERGRVIAAQLRAHHKAKERQGDDQEIWLDHFCIFHPDQHKRSATFQPETGVYVCWGGCGQKPLAEVETRFGIHHDLPTSLEPRPTRLKLLEEATKQGILSQPERVLTPETPISEWLSPNKPKPLREYNYFVTFPDGRPSHIERRFEYADGHHEDPCFHADGQTPGRPADFWPVYDCSKFPSATSDPPLAVVVEGFKCVDVGNAQAELEGVNALFLTTGSHASLKKYAEQLVQSLQVLPHSGVLLWPDNDAPGIEAMKYLKKILDKHGL